MVFVCQGMQGDRAWCRRSVGHKEGRFLGGGMDVEPVEQMLLWCGHRAEVKCGRHGLVPARGRRRWLVLPRVLRKTVAPARNRRAIDGPRALAWLVSCEKWGLSLIQSFAIHSIR